MWTWFHLIVSRIAALFRPRPLDSDFEQEMESHLLLLVEENLRRGMSPAEARREARMRLGGLESLKDQHREVRSLPFFETLLQDLRYTVRTLRRDAGFATFAILPSLIRTTSLSAAPAIDFVRVRGTPGIVRLEADVASVA